MFKRPPLSEQCAPNLLITARRLQEQAGRIPVRAEVYSDGGILVGYVPTVRVLLERLAKNDHYNWFGADALLEEGEEPFFDRPPILSDLARSLLSGSASTGNMPNLLEAFGDVRRVLIADPRWARPFESESARRLLFIERVARTASHLESALSSAPYAASSNSGWQKSGSKPLEETVAGANRKSAWMRAAVALRPDWLPAPPLLPSFPAFEPHTPRPRWRELASEMSSHAARVREWGQAIGGMPQRLAWGREVIQDFRAIHLDLIEHYALSRKGFVERITELDLLDLKPDQALALDGTKWTPHFAVVEDWAAVQRAAASSLPVLAPRPTDRLGIPAPAEEDSFRL